MAEEPRSKRHKISRGDDDYMPGNISKIELCNFMTFNTLTCKPGSRLNLVIGPNGSGKSSLVCAIALGLGGEPQLLGRATSVGAYVKRGEESGYIKISLRGETKEELITITRKIDTRNRSEWLFNGKSVGKKDITEVTQRFNIQVNNLTQFLPQDRVCEFAKLTPVQLLEETEKAVGDPQLPIQHRTLILKSQELKKFERSVESNKGSLEQLKALNAELEKDVERVRQREELLAKAESMKKKLPWLKYDMKKAEYMEAKLQEKDAKLKLDAAAKALNELREPIEKKKEKKTREEMKCKKTNVLLDGNIRKRMQLLEHDNHLGVLIRGKYKEMEDLKFQEESRVRRTSDAKDNLAAAEAELANLPSYEPPRQKVEMLSTRIMELEETIKEIRFQKNDKEKRLNYHRGQLRKCKDRLRELDDVNTKRLQALQKSGAESIFQAYKWVQDHRSEFRKEVYGPVLLEVNVSNRFHADCLEGQVAYYIWKSFITQDSEDRDFLFKNMKSFGVPIINHVEDEGNCREPLRLSNEMLALGISSRLDNVFDAPHAVKEVLISQFKLDFSYIGSKETDEKADMVLRLGIADVWTPENHYRWSKSRYGDHVTANVESVDRSHLLLCNLDVGEIETLKSCELQHEEGISTIETDLKDLQNALRQKEDEAAGFQREREEIVNIIQSKKKKLREMELLVNQRRAKLQAIEREGHTDAIPKLVAQVKDLKLQRFQCAIDFKNLILEVVAYRRIYAETNLASIELEAMIKEMEINAKQQEKVALQESLHFDRCKDVKERCQQQLLASKRDAESVAEITAELKRAFLEVCFLT